MYIFFNNLPIYQPLHMDIFPLLKTPVCALYMYITFSVFYGFFISKLRSRIHSYLCILMTTSGRYRLLMQILFVSLFSSASIHAKSFQYFNLFAAVSYLFLFRSSISASFSTNRLPFRTIGKVSFDSLFLVTTSSKYSHTARYSFISKFNISVVSLS